VKLRYYANHELAFPEARGAQLRVDHLYISPRFVGRGCRASGRGHERIVRDVVLEVDVRLDVEAGTGCFGYRQIWLEMIGVQLFWNVDRPPGLMEGIGGEATVAGWSGAMSAGGGALVAVVSVCRLCDLGRPALTSCGPHQATDRAFSCTWPAEGRPIGLGEGHPS
jgi:hypothetical protein